MHAKTLSRLLGVCLLSALSWASSAPSELIKQYYDAQSTGDIPALKQIMTQFSFDTDMQVYALSIALEDQRFHKILKAYPNDTKAQKIVHKAVAEKFKSRKARMVKKIQEIPIGSDRVMVRFLENGHNKQLYFSKKEESWKIDYLAGRNTH